jgi:IS30 family transposase
VQQSSPPDKAVYRLASGRRQYNHLRQVLALLRRRRLWLHMPNLLTCRGTQARLARELGVHRSTICRDAQRMWDEFCQQREG